MPVGFKLMHADLAPNSSYFLDPQMEMGAVSWWWVTQTVLYGLSAGKIWARALNI